MTTNQNRKYPSSERKLAAILFADIAGYTALMQKNEVKASTLLRRFQKNIEKLIPENNGKIINFYGDGALCIFNNPLESVHCAMALQRSFQDDNNKIGVPVRIGLHSGTVIFENEKIYGDSVNIASRIESMGVPGTILFSKKIRDEIKNQPDLKINSLGNYAFKNVEEEMEVFALANEGFVVPKREEMKGKFKIKNNNFPKIIAALITVILLFYLGYFFISKDDINPISSTPDAIAIFPFDVKGGADIQYLGEAMVDLLSTKLDGIPGINPVDPNLIISRLEDTGRSSPSLDLAKNLSHSFGASNFILGDIVAINDFLTISASKYNDMGQLVIKKSVDGKQENLVDLIDRLIKELIAKELSQAGQEFNSLAVLTSQNFPALQAYLQGEQAYRKTNIYEAFDHYVDAIQLDSTFVMAWWQLDGVSGWIPNLSYPGAGDKVEKYKDKLSEKWRAFHEIKKKYSTSNPRIIPAIQRLMQQYGESREFTFRIAEHLFHYNSAYGKSIAEAKPWLLKTKNLDPNNHEALIHLMDIALMENDTAAMHQILSETDSASQYWPLYKHRVLSTKDKVTNAEIQEILTHPYFEAFGLSPYMAAPEDINKYLEYTLQFYSYLPGEERRKERNERKQWGIQGKERAAYTVPTHIVGIKDVTAKREIWDSLWSGQKLQMAIPALLIADRNFLPLSEHHEDLFQQLKGIDDPWALYASAKYCLTLEKGTACDEIKIQLKEKAKEDSGFRNPARFFHYSLLAFEARIANNNEEALAWIDSAYQYSPGGWGKLDAFMDKLFMQADIYQEMGAFEKSITYMENIPVLQAFPFAKGYATYRLGQLYELNGEYNEAIRKCDLLIKDYQNCDPKYKPWVEEAKERRQRLINKTN